ncbi:lipocalin-like domain-containing protein [Streptomyces sp. NPDC091267]|uniref:lipocalin-like domain-containing protein n=1 Tax=Streptomyces sp. NPDC091267 TaxID=3155195 RepID=UPI00341BA187
MTSPATRRPPHDHPLVGAWELVSFEVHGEDGRTAHPLGPEPAGLGIYTGKGLVSAQLMADRRVPAVPAQGPVGRGYLAYTGRYVVDTGARTVEHHVECSLEPTWVGTVLHRTYELDGDLLTLRPFEHAALRPVLIWRRREH